VDQRHGECDDHKLDIPTMGLFSAIFPVEP
jgi:hypothetical protein